MLQFELKQGADCVQPFEILPGPHGLKPNRAIVLPAWPKQTSRSEVPQIQVCSLALNLPKKTLPARSVQS